MRWLRAIYALEFLLALLVAVFAWPMVAGQGHVDYVPWEWKLGLTAAFAASVVMATRAAVGSERVVSRGVLSWILVVTMVMAGMGYFAYLAHLEEEETDGPDVFRSRGGLDQPLKPLLAEGVVVANCA